MAVTLELQPDGALKISRILRAPAAIIAASRALESIVEAAYEPVPPESCRRKSSRTHWLLLRCAI